MKKNIFIKRISIVMFTFLCMFLLSNQVKADNETIKYFDENGEQQEYTLTAEDKLCEYGKLSGGSGITSFIELIAYKYYLIISPNDFKFYSTSMEEWGENVALDSPASYEFDFNHSDLNGQCPKELYVSLDENYDQKTNRHYKVSKEKNSDTLRSLGLYTSIIDKDYSDSKDVKKSICEGKTIALISSVFTFIRYLIPIAVIVFSIISFLGVVLSGETDSMEKAKKYFVIRIVAGFGLLIFPFLIELVLRLAGLIGNDASIVAATCEELFK